MIVKTSQIAISALVCLGLAGCASTSPPAPTLAVMPGKGKSYEAFQRDDRYCQSTASAAIHDQSPGEAANQAAAGTALAGTALGALAGAAIGSTSGNVGAGAAIGAGAGLLAGSAVGAGQANAAGGSLQSRYDTVYAQCMTAKGNEIPRPAYVAGPPVVVEQPVYVERRPYWHRHYDGW